jgi:hypothetical protein
MELGPKDACLRLVFEQFDDDLHALGDEFRCDVSRDLLEDAFAQRGEHGKFDELLSGRGVFVAGECLDALAGAGSTPWRSSSARWIARCATEEDDWGYRLHDGREVKMMLAGEKPFGFVMIPAHAEDPRPAIFERLAREGRIRLKVVEIRGTRTFLLASSGEEWRWQAFLLLHDVASREGWTPAIERYLGRLLGYSDQEIDIYLKNTSG